jgi:cytochrome c-type biogenesis protein CcsB
MKKSLKLLLNVAGVVALSMIFSSCDFEPRQGDNLRTLPVQDSGRVKPFDSFSRETLELIYGRTKFKKDDGTSEPAHLIVMSFILSPESWVNAKIFEVTHLEVRNRLKLPQDRKHYSGEEIFKNEAFKNLMQELADKRESKEKLTPYFQALQRIENQFFTFRELSSGQMLRVLPNSDPAIDRWIALTDLPSDMQPAFISITQKLAGYLGAKTALHDSPNAETKNKLAEAAIAFDEAVQNYKKLAIEKFGDRYDSMNKSSKEVFYNDVHPFRWAYIFYLLAALILLIIWIKGYESGMKLVWTMVGLGFFIHTAGFAFRVYLSGRAPVTNMYETVVWVSWGVILFAAILEKIYKSKAVILAGSLMGVLCLIIADTAPAILDPTLQPLEAVLRSNYWLTVHVMTITISYAAFALAFGLGDMGLVYYLIDEVKHKENIQKITTGIYRSMQIGVAFLAPGIILGGIWADYSWGRFWGWDPKETWALIALMGYIIVLHARLVNWLQNFGTVVAAIVTFNLVIMAWYGVNFVLGAGLHSYGFGAGGIEYVSIFVLLHILFIVYVWLVRNKNQRPALK